MHQLSWENFVLTCLVLCRVQGVIARGAAEIFASLTFSLVRRDGYGLAIPSAVFLLKNGMHYDCLKGTVRYHIKGHNCKTSYQPKFQTSQWSHEGQSCFWEIFCPGSNPLTSSSPVIPAHSFSSNLKDEWVKKHLTNIHHRKLNLKSSELWSWMDLFFISFSP